MGICEGGILSNSCRNDELYEKNMGVLSCHLAHWGLLGEGLSCLKRRMRMSRGALGRVVFYVSWWVWSCRDNHMRNNKTSINRIIHINIYLYIYIYIYKYLF